MRCPSCGFDNPTGMKFCGHCATLLTLPCPRCGFNNPPQFKFCGYCATPLTEARPPEQETKKQEQEYATAPESPVPSRPTSHPSRTVPEAERRHLTVMFCDQVDSVSRSQRLDPEEFRELTRQYQQMCAQVIRACEGHIAQHHGDGLLAYFGYPSAHEDDARRAVRAGLGILSELPRLNAHLQQTIRDLYDFPLQLRLGIHSGVTVVGEIGTGERRALVAVGDTPNVAARLQGIASPNSVVISEDTYRLTAGFFECRHLGPQSLKGVSSPVSVYQPLRESNVQGRFEASATAGLTPLVGRKEELGLLLERWGQVKEGEGWLIMLSGEAGIGKSRLLREFKEQITQDTYARLECHCSPYHQNSAFYPVIGLFQRLLDFQRDDSSQERMHKLEVALEQAGFSPPETVPLFASLLSLPLSASRFSLPSLTPQRQRQKILEASLAWLLRLAQQQPVLLVVEDLQWIDPSTLELLSLFIDRGPTARILTLLTFRPDLFSPPWTPRSHLIRLTLGRLPRKQAEVMVEKVAGRKILPAAVLRQLVDKTDGVPLFVEELTKMVLESGLLREREHRYELVGPLPPLAIPATLHDSLMARLDRLGAVKETAQLAATLGREFTYELIHAISPVDEAALQHALARLAEAELLYQRGLPPQTRYIFKHALIQEAAYQSLLKSKRQQFHQQIAQVLEERFLETKETQPELLAHHYTQAGLIKQAISYWQGAGQRAVERSANVEAISHLTKGLELLKTLPDTQERAQQEIVLQIALGAPLLITKGLTAPEVENTYARARDLCRRVGKTPQLFQALLGLLRFYAVRGEFQTAHELAGQCLHMAESVRDPVFLSWAHCLLGEVLFYKGELVSAREHVEQGIALYDPQLHRSRVSLYGQDPKVGCLYFASLALWLLGYPDQALKRSYEAITLAQELSRPFSLAGALNFAATVHQFRREGKAAQEQAEAAVALSTEHGIPQWLMVGTIVQGWALAEQGQIEEGIVLMRQGLAAQRASGVEMSRPYFLVELTEAYAKGGQIEEGLNAVAEALTVVDRTGDHVAEAELYRLKGQLTLAQSSVQGLASSVPNTQHPTPNTQEAEACFYKAINIARRQQAKSWELRAVISLARLWQHQGKQAEARQMLAEIYSWFTEGFETADLRAAQALLKELG